MDELDFDGKKYLSSKRAAEITGYAKDYVGQLCREGRVEARLVGRAWYVSESSIRDHRFGTGEVAEAEVEIEPYIRASTEESENIEKEELANAWGTSRYASEEVDLVPSLHVRTERIVTTTPQGSSVHQMQSVWQDWFDNKDTKAMAEHKEAPEDVRRAADDATIPPARVEEEESEYAPFEMSTVSIHRMPTYERAQQRTPEIETRYADVPRREVRMPEPERTTRRATRAYGTNFVIQALLVACMLLVVSGTFVALGYGANILHISNGFVVDYLTGVSK